MSMECKNCYSAEMKEPEDGHPGYRICPSCGAFELTYEPQDYQMPLHSIPEEKVWSEKLNDYIIRTQIIGVFGGFGSGKSRASLTEIFFRALQNPKGTGLLTAPTLQQLKRTSLKTFFKEICPPPFIKRYNKAEGEIELINGFTFYTIPSDDEEKLRSINAGLIHMEEASGIKRSIFDQLLTRMRDPFVKNRAIIVCSNPDLGWIKEIFVDNEAKKDPKHPQHHEYNPYIYTFVWPTRLNKHLPSDFIEMNARGKPEWWVKRYLEGSFEHSEGMVYPNFARIVIDPFDIPEHWERCISLDHGLRNPTAVLFGAIDPEKGILYIYDEYYEANRIVPEHAKALKPKIHSIPAGLLRFMVADPSIKNRTDPVNGRSVQGLYQDYGLFFSEGNNNIEAGILRVNSYIDRGKLKIFRNCVNLIKEGLNYKFPEVTMDNINENLDERPVKAHDHAMDALRYMLMRLPEDPELLKARAFEPSILFFSANGFKENEYGWVEEMQERYGGDYLDYV